MFQVNQTNHFFYGIRAGRLTFAFVLCRVCDCRGFTLRVRVTHRECREAPQAVSSVAVSDSLPCRCVRPPSDRELCACVCCKFNRETRVRLRFVKSLPSSFLIGPKNKAPVGECLSSSDRSS
jgi:hypothetical protein